MIRSRRGLTGLFGRLLRRREAGTGRLEFAEQPAAIYAIGDIHGRLDLLAALEALIQRDAARQGGECWIICLGDLVDRGPASAGVIDHLLHAAPSGLRRMAVRGNHEAAMLAFIERPDARAAWLLEGGRETLLSYGIPPRYLDPRQPVPPRRLARALSAYIPDEHRTFLAGLPVLIETPRAVFVHAGLRPGLPLARQRASDLLSFNDGLKADYSEFGKFVVHGHVQVPKARIVGHRVAVDTGAYHSQVLSAAAILADGSMHFISTSQ